MRIGLFIECVVKFVRFWDFVRFGLVRFNLVVVVGLLNWLDGFIVIIRL